MKQVLQFLTMTEKKPVSLFYTYIITSYLFCPRLHRITLNAAHYVLLLVLSFIVIFNNKKNSGFCNMIMFN